MNNKYIISLSFGNYLKGDGGVDKAIREHQEMYNYYGISYVHISPFLPKILNKKAFCKANFLLYSIVIDGNFYGLFDEYEISVIINRFKGKIKAIHIHHLKKFKLQFLMNILSSCSVKKYLFIHDYYTICKQPNLLKNGEYFCGIEKKKSQKCKDCLYYNSIDEHQLLTKTILSKFTDIEVVSPSEIAAIIWDKTYDDYIPLSKIKIIPHQKAIGENKCFPAINNKIKIAFIGRFDENKGSREWKQFVNSVDHKDAALDLFYFGMSNLSMDRVKNVRVKVNKSNPNMMVDKLREYGINCAFLWSICPETYSYAYFEAFSANSFIITNLDSGNIAAMTKKNKNGIVFDNISEFIKLIEDFECFKKKLIAFSESNIFGPLHYKNNDDILSLLDEKEYTLFINNLSSRIPKPIKRLLTCMYSKQHNLGSCYKIGDIIDDA